MLTTLPLEAFVCREVMTNYFYPTSPFSTKIHLLFTTGLVVSAVALSLLTCDLGAVFELIGATSACALAYILPPLCYMKLSTRSWKWAPAVACVVFGGIVMGISLVTALRKIIKSKSSSSSSSSDLREAGVEVCGWLTTREMQMRGLQQLVEALWAGRRRGFRSGTVCGVVELVSCLCTV